MMNLPGDPAGRPQRAKTYTGDYITALTGWAATMMALWEVKKTGRGQVVDLAQFEAVAQTSGNTLPLFTGEGAVYGHSGNRPPGFQPYDTFKCSDGWVYIGALGGPIYDRVPKFLGLDPAENSYDECSKDAAAVDSEKGRELDRRLREYCAARTSLEVETELNEAKIGCAGVYNTRDQYHHQHYAAPQMTGPVPDRPHPARRRPGTAGRAGGVAQRGALVDVLVHPGVDEFVKPAEFAGPTRRQGRQFLARRDGLGPRLQHFRQVARGVGVGAHLV